MKRTVVHYAVAVLAAMMVALPGCMPTSTPTSGGITVSEGKFFFIGTIESMSVDAWVIGGQIFRVNEDTKLDEGLVIGVLAEVEFDTLPDGSMLANEIENKEEIFYIGIVHSIGADAWAIGGYTFKVDKATKLDAGLAVGVLANVEFDTMPDGSMLATEIETDALDTVRQSLP